jgi:para-nitrobenzyl esterase
MSHATGWRRRLLAALAVPAALGLCAFGLAGPAAAHDPHDPHDPSVVHTAAGAVRGTVGGDFRSFLGIPFAAPPLGELRWQAPRPAARWRGVRDATSFASPCPSLPTIVAGASGVGSTNEDCLYLNVYTPRSGTRHHLPVMVWIHGGGFINGAGSDYDARVLTAKGDAVVVTINYRLGVFGFLALPGLSAEARDHASGNFGLQDQQAALRWVRRNIAAFGGNPGNVTIFGESAGGASVCAQLASPTARGLFERAIIESGPCASPLSSQSPTVAAAERTGVGLAQRVGCADPATQVACMRAQAVAPLLAAGGAGVGTWRPVVGGAVLPQPITAAISSGDFNRVPTVQGSNHDEYRLFVALLFDLPGRPVTAAQYPGLLAAQFGANGAKVLAEYPLANYGTPSEALSAVVTDASFACPARATDALLAGHVPTWGYEFADRNAPQFLFTDPVMPLGAFHAAEIPFIFQPQPDVVPTFFTPAQLALSNEMIRYWSRFAATGNPNSSATPAWPRYSSRGDLIQSLAPDRTGPTAGFAADHHCSFWASLSMA